MGVLWCVWCVCGFYMVCFVVYQCGVFLAWPVWCGVCGVVCVVHVVCL